MTIIARLSLESYLLLRPTSLGDPPFNGCQTVVSDTRGLSSTVTLRSTSIIVTPFSADENVGRTFLFIAKLTNIILISQLASEGHTTVMAFETLFKKYGNMM